MPNFKDFISSVKDNQKLLDFRQSSNELATKISGSLILGKVKLSNSESERFSSEVANLAHSEEVLTELSNKIGAPKKEETEEEFVERAKLTLANILKNKLLK